jgi:hypothetical protein
MDFGEVLTRAWKISWKFKIMWIFGIFAGCGTGNRFSFATGGHYQNSNFPDSSPNLSPDFVDNMLRFLPAFNKFMANPAAIAGFIGLICVIFLVMSFFSIVGHVGLIKGALDADAGAEHLGFGGLWKNGLHYFWRILGLSLLIGSPGVLVFLGIILGAFLILFTALPGPYNHGQFGTAAQPLIAIIPILCILLCAVILLAIFISFLGPQAERAIVIEEEGVIGGIRRGWNVLTRNLGPILIVWLIVVVIGIVAGLLLELPLLAIVAPAIMAFIFSGGSASYTPLVIAGFFILAYIPVSLVANGILTAYLESVWTLAYLRLVGPKPDAQAPIVIPNA